ncbi:MAG: hypothetical protein PHI11_08985 [Gallionella sp.]|nr:hypothetical protein [Gallionella sp.]
MKIDRKNFEPALNSDKESMNFPSNWPSNCPLQSAVDCQHTVFMAFTSKPATANQCKSQAERNRAQSAIGDGACTRHGLSVFPSFNDCKHQVALLPHLGPYIGKAYLTASHGKIAETPARRNPAHMTWWPYQGVDRHSLFSNFVEEN